MDKYKITKIDAQTGNITVSFTADDKPQILSGMPLDDLPALEGELAKYNEAYKAGLEIEKVKIAPEVTAIIGVEKDIKV